MPRLLGQLHIELAVDRAELGLWRQVKVLIKARVARNMPRQLLRMLNNAGDGRVNLLGHFVQEIDYLNSYQHEFITLCLG